MTSPTVLSTIRTALKGQDVPSWQRYLAFSLASSMDDRPSASTAKELRALMAEMLGEVKAESTTKDAVDDISARIAARRQASGS
jgi:RNase P/RNase MRP subunit POP5